MVINISQASNIDENTFIGTLLGGRLGSTAQDNFESEPELDPCFLKRDNALFQLHRTGDTTVCRKTMGKLVQNNLTAYFTDDSLLAPVL